MITRKHAGVKSQKSKKKKRKKKPEEEEQKEGLLCINPALIIKRALFLQKLDRYTRHFKRSTRTKTMSFLCSTSTSANARTMFGSSSSGACSLAIFVFFLTGKGESSYVGERRCGKEGRKSAQTRKIGASLRDRPKREDAKAHFRANSCGGDVFRREMRRTRVLFSLALALFCASSSFENQGRLG